MTLHRLEAPLAEFKSFVPHDATERELTLKGVSAGIMMATILGAAKAYLGMDAEETVAAPFPSRRLPLRSSYCPFSAAAGWSRS